MSADTAARAVRLILVGGHESSGRTDLIRLEQDGIDTAVPGRSLHAAVTRAMERDELVVTVPMTFGRDPTMVADAAKTLRWLARGQRNQIVLAAPFGSITHLTALLRSAANKARAQHGSSAVLIHALHSNTFDEAELHRVAYLVAVHGALSEVAVSIADDRAALEASISRLAALGHAAVTVVPAGFALGVLGNGPASPGVTYGGPLIRDTAISHIARTRASEALQGLARGDDGIEAGGHADHGHGYAHSHAFEEAPHGHSHSAGPFPQGNPPTEPASGVGKPSATRPGSRRSVRGTVR